MDIQRTVFHDDHEMLRETARRFFERECLPRQAEWGKAGRTDRETWQVMAHQSPDHQEAVAAFIEKRPPRFQG